MKTWMCYEEDGEIKAIETTGGLGEEMELIANELGLKVLSHYVFKSKRDAIDLTKFALLNK